MDFIQFAQAHGLEIRTFHDDGKWHRCPTTDHPKKQNGAYKFCGDHGFVQNHATMDRVEVWKTDRPVNLREYMQKRKSAQIDIANEAASAARKAEFMLSKAIPDRHDYFFLKGHPDHICMTLQRDDTKLALIPMRVNNKLTSLQIISFQDGKWRKTFLKNGVTKGAVFRFGAGPKVLCEGYATGLSAALALRSARIPAEVVVCFSAHNMRHMATQERVWMVIADNDASGTGQRVAEEIGAATWISKTTGNDLNDDHLQRGLFAVSQDLKLIAMKNSKLRR